MRSAVTAGFSLALILMIATVATSHRRALAIRRSSPVDAHTFAPPPSVGRILAMGENELLADLAWVKTLIYYGDGLVHDTGMPDVEELVALINALDPRFRRPYLWGAYATTFRKRTATQDEYVASVAILRRGVAAFPRDWELNWLLGLRLFLDIKAATDEEQRKLREEGAMYIERAMRLPRAPSTLPFLAVSLRTKLGQTERALRELREMILITEDERARAELQARYALLASEAASADLAQEARAMDEAWKINLPYAPRTLYLLLGPPPSPAMDLDPLTDSVELNME
jgi:hypothetical protein